MANTHYFTNEGYITSHTSREFSVEIIGNYNAFGTIEEIGATFARFKTIFEEVKGVLPEKERDTFFSLDFFLLTIREEDAVLDIISKSICFSVFPFNQKQDEDFLRLVILRSLANAALRRQKTR